MNGRKRYGIDIDEEIDMSLNIKNSEVERLLEDIVGITGETKTEAIRKALDERRERLILRAVAPVVMRGCSPSWKMKSGPKCRRSYWASRSRKKRKRLSWAILIKNIDQLYLITLYSCGIQQYFIRELHAFKRLFPNPINDRLMYGRAA